MSIHPYQGTRRQTFQRVSAPFFILRKKCRPDTPCIAVDMRLKSVGKKYNVHENRNVSLLHQETGSYLRQDPVSWWLLNSLVPVYTGCSISGSSLPTTEHIMRRTEICLLYLLFSSSALSQDGYSATMTVRKRSKPPLRPQSHC